MVLPEPDLEQQLRRHAKRELRRRMKALRSALPPAAIAERSARIVEQLTRLPEFEAARALALFWPISEKNEVDLRAADARARSAGKLVFYPFMDATDDGYRTGFRRVSDPAELAERGRGFCEPLPTAPVAARGDVDLVVVPALAVSTDGQRLGYGIGFYDATLPDVCPPARSVVVAFSFQLLVELPHEPSDVGCDVVVTDERVIVEADRPCGP